MFRRLMPSIKLGLAAASLRACLRASLRACLLVAVPAVAVPAVAASSVAAQDMPEQIAPQSIAPKLALMGSVPIYWGEADGLDELIEGTADPHWARAALEHEFDLTPLDFLTSEALAPHKFLMMAQPRALAAEENVALDAWVRGGGKLLLFVDPMMTGHSRFSIGDRRRPMDVTLLSPILQHWGLDLHFDERQNADIAMLEHFAAPLPVSLPGQFIPAEGRFECTVSGEGVLAHCALGSGEVLALADAAMLDLHGPHQGAPEALHMLTSHLFGPFGDEWGNNAADSGNSGDQHQIRPDNPPHAAHFMSSDPP